MRSERSSGGRNAGTTCLRRLSARGLARIALNCAAIAAVFFMVMTPLVAQRTRNGTSSLGIQVSPAVQVTTDNTNAYVWIRLGTGGNGSTWGSNTNTCTSPITGATSVASSGKYTYALSSIPFTTADAYVCALDPANGTPLTASAAWPHTDQSLSFSQQPTNASAGASISPAVTVKVIDSNGIWDTTSSALVTIAISSGTGTSGATLSGTLTQTAVNGLATFNNLSINKDGTGYTLTATSSGLTQATSSSLSIGSNTASQLVFTTQPGGGASGLAWTTQPVVTVEDAFGNPVTTSTAPITLAITSGAGTAGATLACNNNPVSATSGVTTFSGCAINLSGTGFTLTATSSGLTSGTSSSFSIAAGPAAQLAFTTEPGGGTGSTAWTTQPVVTLEDANGNLVTGTAQNVTLAIETNPSGGTLSGTTTVAINTSTGKAVFSGLSINTAGTGYVLTATGSTVNTASGLALSSNFNITVGSATQLVFTTQPSGGTGGSAWTTQPVVSVEDAGGNLVTTSSASITLAIGTNPGGGTLSCATNPQSAVSGVATFAGCAINLVGTGYTVKATSGGLTTATSSAFNIATGGGNQLVITTQPGGGTGGTAWTTQPVVTLEDSGGNTVTGTALNVNLAIQTNPSGGTLSGTTTVAINTLTGKAVFSGLSINKSGTGYALTATGSTIDTTPGLVVSSAFNVTVGSAAQLVLTAQPSGGIAGMAWTTQPVVTVEDAGSNPVTGSTASITLAITSGSGTSGAALTCTSDPLSATAGVAAFDGCAVNLSGAGYSLTATSTGLTSAISSSFNITAGQGTQLVFTTQPGGGTGSTAWATQPVVTLEDDNGNVVTGTAQNVTLAILTNPSGGTLSGTTTVAINTSTGKAVFSGLAINTAGTGYVLTATGTTVDLSPGASVSNAFNITVGSATQLIFTTEPSGGTAATAWTTQPALTLEDAGGNVVTTSTALVTLAIGTNPGGGTLSCTVNPLIPVSGVVTFAGCKINLVGNGYTLTATSLGLTPATSFGFNIATGGGNQLVFTTQPGGGTGGTAWTTQPVVTLEDAGGNTVTGTALNVTLAFEGNPSGGTLSGTTTVAINASTGQAVFSGLSVNKSGTGYTLTATGSTIDTTPGLVVSSAFNITVGTAAQLTFSQQPGGGKSSTAWTTQPWVTALDAGGNTVTSTVESVTLAITSGTGTAGAALTCTANPKNTTSGVVKFAGCKVNLVGSGYTLTATSGSLISATSGGFSITPGAAKKLIITTQPGGGTGGTAWSTQPVVTVEDAAGNTVTGSSASVKLAITGSTGTSGAALVCTTNPLAASEGVVTFAGCAINLAGTGYTLKAASSGVTAATSSAFNITVGSATQLNVTTNTTGGKGGTAWTTQPVVMVEDAGGNTVTTSTASITLAIGTNPNGGTLTCTANPVTASAGVATFAGCAINLVGTGYTLTANSSGLTGDTNNPFNITVGAAVQLAFTQQPSGGTAGTPWTTQPVVAVEDAGGNTVTSSAASITLTITSGTGTSGANLTCTTNPLSATAGVASFAGCEINLSGTGYTLTAAHTSLTSAISNGFSD